MANATGTIADANRTALIDFFRDGCKDRDAMGRLGVEVEHFVIMDDGAPVPYEPCDGKLGISEVLDFLAEHYPVLSFNTKNELLGLAADDGSISLEPAAQIEISIAPYRSVGAAKRAYDRFHSLLDPFLASRGARVWHSGYHPSRKARSLELIPKQRYRFMDDYFRHIGSHGERMMRASASTQISVDYYSEDDAVRKMRVAQAMAPVLAAICDNTQVFEGETNSTPIQRLQLWREVDDLRCGVVPGIFEEGFGFASYADWLLRTPPIFVTRPAASDPDGPRLRQAYSVSAGEVYGDAPMTRADVEHLLSMFWPDVRLKRFVEIRPADSIPEAQAAGYTALIKGIFYSEASLAGIEEALGAPVGGEGSPGWPIGERQVEDAIASVRRRGFGGDVYGRTLEEWERLLFGLAGAAIPPHEASYLAPLSEFAQDKAWWDVES